MACVIVVLNGIRRSGMKKGILCLSPLIVRAAAMSISASALNRRLSAEAEAPPHLSSLWLAHKCTRSSYFRAIHAWTRMEYQAHNGDDVCFSIFILLLVRFVYIECDFFLCSIVYFHLSMGHAWSVKKSIKRFVVWWKYSEMGKWGYCTSKLHCNRSSWNFSIFRCPNGRVGYCSNECCTGNIYYYVVPWTIISPQRGEHSCCQQPKYRSLFQRHISHLAFIKFVLKIYQNPEKKSIAVECYKFHHDQINYQNYFVSNQIFKVHCLAIDYANKTAAIFYLHMRRYCNANPLE